jgi:D-alanyl-D-alanine carboxypeptidase
MRPSTALRMTLMTATLTVAAACGASRQRESRADQSFTETQEPPASGATTTASVPAERPELGNFPEFPQGRLTDSVAVELQALLDAAVAEGPMRGISAAVVVAGSGSWSGAAGVNPTQDGIPMTPASILPAQSVGKTVIAAQVLRLVEERKLGLNDRAADHLPADFPSFSSADLRDVTIRQLLGMRSGLTDRGGPASADPGPTPVYANVNYDILAAIIDHVTGSQLPEVVHAGVLSGSGLDGLVFDADGVRWPHDGHMRADAATMARWGYELYGGFVLSDTSLHEMLDFGGEWYGLGVIDFTHRDLPSGGPYDSPSVGHGGAGNSEVIRLVAFGDAGVVVYLWAAPGSFAAIRPLVEDLRDAAQR